MPHSSLITRVVLQNYRSFRTGSVRLSPLTFLIGPNASGKSNFLDAIQFVADALAGTLEQSVEKRGGITALRHKHRGDDPFVRFRFEMTFADGGRAHYAFELEHVPFGCRARKEECALYPAGSDSPLRYRASDETVVQQSSRLPLPTSGRELFLSSKFVMSEFHVVRDALAGNGVYNLSSASLKTPTLVQGDPMLGTDGRNLACVLWQMKETAPESFARVTEYLAKIFPPLHSIEFNRTWSNELQKYDVENGEVGICLMRKAPAPRHLWNLPADSLSDGTLRALAILCALFQHGPTPLVGIEEPENGLHPGAFGVLLDALNEASRQRQICVTSHSPDVLQATAISADSILTVQNHDGDSTISPLPHSARAALQQRLRGLDESALPIDDQATDCRIFDDSNLQ